MGIRMIWFGLAAARPSRPVPPEEVRGLCLQALLRCLPYVLADEIGQDSVGSIDAGLWQEASQAMAITGYAFGLVPMSNSLDSSLWPRPSTGRSQASRDLDPALVVDGSEVSRSMRAEAAARAAAFETRAGRKPRLGIVTVGAGHPDGAQRKRLFGREGGSWFDKAELCRAAGIEPVNIRLPDAASFAAVHDSIQALNRRCDIDAIILERPLPSALDADVLGSYICADKDVDNERRSSEYADGGAFMANQGIFQAAHDLQLDLAPSGRDEVLARPPRPPWLCQPPAVLPCTVEGILQLLHRSGLMDTVVPKGLTVVVGRSPQVIAHCPLTTCLLCTEPRATVYSAVGRSRLRSQTASVTHALLEKEMHPHRLRTCLWGVESSGDWLRQCAARHCGGGGALPCL